MSNATRASHVPSSEFNTLLRASDESRRSGCNIKKNIAIVASVVAAVAIGTTVIFCFPRNSPQRNTTSESSPQTLIVHLEAKPSDDDSRSDDDVTSEVDVCNDGRYAKRTMQLAYELPFASLFMDNKGSRKFEASSVILSDDKKTAYAICDSSWAIFRFGVQLTPFGDNNMVVGDVNREQDEDSGYEAIFRDKETFYVVRESILHNTTESNLGGYHASIEEVKLGEDRYDVVRKCSSEFEFEGNSKGFEGAAPIHDLNSALVVLALCEGNHCSEKHKKQRDVGNGRIVAMRQEIHGETCIWKTIRTINLPKSAAFKDYSAISITPSGKVGVTSQEDSQFWVGQLLGQKANGLWDIDAVEFDETSGIVYDFPKDHQCYTVYCNIEGIHWINDDIVIAVSDKMKGRGRQDFRCFDKDQSVHVFMLPE